jgi:tetratricopeptide (TPR) repeat protein
MSAQAAGLGMAALVNAYNSYTGRDRTSDLNRLIDLAKYSGETFADADQGDAAKITLGDIYAGMGKYEEAAKVFESVREGSSRRTDALDKAGFAHWRQSLVLRDREKTAEADSEAKTAHDELKSALDARQKAGASPSDVGLLNNASELAEVYLATDRGKEALDLLAPLASAPTLSQPSPALAPAVSRLLATLLRSHISVGDTDKALADMKRLEDLGGRAEGKLTQLYYELGKLLEKEMEARKRRGDSAGYDRTQAAYQKFLQALVASKAGQSYDSLQWAGEAMLSLSRSAAEQAEDSKARRMVREADAAMKTSRELAKEATGVFDRILQTYANDEAFKKDPRAQARLLRTQLKRVAALRGQEQFAPAEEALSTLSAQNPRLLEPLMERGLLDEARAQTGAGKWAEALDRWSKLAARLRVMSPKPVEYYEATYHVAYCLMKMGEPDKAKATLKGVMRISRNLGTPEMKAKYDSLLKQLGA